MADWVIKFQKRVDESSVNKYDYKQIRTATRWSAKFFILYGGFWNYGNGYGVKNKEDGVEFYFEVDLAKKI